MLPASFNIPHLLGQAPWYDFQRKSGCIRIKVNYQKLIKVTEIPQIAFRRVDEVLDTLCGGSVFSIIELFSGITQLIILPDTIPLTAFSTPTGLYKWFRMSQGALVLPPGLFGHKTCYYRPSKYPLVP